MRLVVAIFGICAVWPAFAANERMTELVTELQSSERLVAAAISASDLEELSSQRWKTVSLAKQMLEQPGLDLLLPCVKASTALFNITGSLIAPNNARGALELQDHIVDFAVTMDICEERLTLPPTRPPNLGRAPR